MPQRRATDYDKRVAMQIFAHAFDTWTTDGIASIRCDACDQIIEFRRHASAVHHDCFCGKFQGQMQSQFFV